jgi:hypothetical protein
MHCRKNPIYLSFEMSAHNSEDHVSYGQIFYSLKHILFVYQTGLSILLKVQSKVLLRLGHHLAQF